MKWGVIGTGNMGSILIHAWMSSRVISEDELFVTNRTIDKAISLQEEYKGIHVCETPAAVASQVDILFICVKPGQIFPLLTELYPVLKPEQCLISITSPYSVKRLESLVPCQVARMIPSITNRALAGITLFTFGSRINKEMKGYLLQSSRLFSNPEVIDEDITRIASDFVSCGPAFFSFLAQKYIEAACLETKISKETASKLIEKMFIGYGKLMEDGHFTLEELIGKVCVKGGITGEGIKVIEEDVGEMFYHLVLKTHDKYREEKKKISCQIYDS
ncbi:late competence protein ComER [Sediminibacillus massiliensis]|uniref:late competence protein ComER n=1 Tax=Sediminibacillus massiliensis TaxID=1926277 RepID=UPI0009883717|nr:late competence protein ComER [Sediminibacillus massiliensis]